MYSKKQLGNIRSAYPITPPPGYDGSRFRRRSDGRDDSFPPYNGQPEPSAATAAASDIQKGSDEEIFSFDMQGKQAAQKQGAPLFPILKNGIGNEELLIIALLIVLISENKISAELMLMLGLLLCI